ncbi:MAG: V-type ATPase 116kDa subunit family protein [Candidatus Omnitrophota bacterium]|nr:V-type ATPase 116kDa subunit family protein [Candidatus Omnitrophota bacterium]
MIVAMKKVFLFLQKEHARTSLSDLASLGLLHIEHQNPPDGEEINALGEKLALVEQAILILSCVYQKIPPISLPPKDVILACHHIVDLQKRSEQLKEYAITLNGWIDQWSPWGDFDPQEISQLTQKNIFAKLYQIPREQLKSLSQRIVIKKISSEGSMDNCIVFCRENIQLSFRELELPKMSLAQMRQRLAEDAQIILNLKKELSEYLNYQDELLVEKKALMQQKNYFEALQGMGQAEQLVYLKGYVPVDAEEALVTEAKQRGWGIFTAVPQEDDEVPTLLRNPAWISFIKPLLNLLELIPGYRELDISPLFIVFFSLFFGMLIGDAGYGLVYFLLNFWLHKKIGHKIKDQSVFFLFYILSFCAIIWGFLTGTFFGQAWLLNIGIKPLIPALTDTTFIQGLCFLIGAVHLSLAHGWRAILKAPALIALAELGWICIIWAVFLLAKNLILGDPFPLFGNQLIILGLILVLFFTNPQKNIFKTIGSGLGTISLTLVNNFTDVVSYIRLFAVGLATVAIADAFNAMAAGIVKKGNLLTLIAAALVVICGHVLNIIIGPISVLIHGVRLNVLEFCGHLGVTWNGFAYKPFGRKE